MQKAKQEVKEVKERKARKLNIIVCGVEESMKEEAAGMKEDDEKKNKAHNECAERETVTNDVTAIIGNEEMDEAHKECAESKRLANDVTPVNDDEREK